ncbi:MAG: TA system VapC family ribonuclease toxin [Acidobacteriota bacterium]
MARVALLDVNVLVALFMPEHVHHELAHDWFADHQGAGWATCAVTENGFIRVVTQLPGENVLRPETAVEHFRRFCAAKSHQFWADRVSVTDPAVFKPAYIRGHRQITDIYLLGLATAMRGYLATFDESIPLKAVIGATAANLQVIGE